ncbi:DUF3854 domain-containing protein [Candidatus Poribacteria bacterium]|nr:DUF3854 domain-containing protein [Candidatus Poribacteria bacterium]
MFTEERATGFIRVTPQNRCPVCDSDHYCSFFTDMSAVVCMRIESDRSYETGIGIGYIHQLNSDPSRYHDTHLNALSPSSNGRGAANGQGAAKKSNRATPAVLHSVYTFLRSSLSLSLQHRQNLIDRGLTAEEIKPLGYVSLPQALSRLPMIQSLVEQHGEKLLSVPGFYVTRSGKLWLAGRAGILIPCKNVDGHIIGFQIRVDSVQGEQRGSILGRIDPSAGKYRWLSATARQRRKGGVSSGTPIHVAKVDAPFRGRERFPRLAIHVPAGDRVWITEGILKADIASLLLNETVIGIAGIGSWKLLELRDVLNRLDVRNVVIGFDADAKQNAMVAKAQKRLAAAIASMGYSVWTADWDIEQGKGIDDVLVSRTVQSEASFEPFGVGGEIKLNRYCPPVNVSSLKKGKQKRKVTSSARNRPRCEAEGYKPKAERETEGIGELRFQLKNRVESFAQFGDGVLLIKAPPGLGKTVTTLDVVDRLHGNGILRPVVAMPRHELIDENIRDGWLHIRPRKPIYPDCQNYAPYDNYRYMRMHIDDAAYFRQVLDVGEMPILCCHHKRADILGGKRYSVPTNLCTSECEIGKTFGTQGCPYFMQYRDNRPIMTVHETLFIPDFCDKMFGAEPLYLNHQAGTCSAPAATTSPATRQICIIDEPSPSKFLEKVNITVDDLSRAIVSAWDENLKKLLEVVRSTIETVARLDGEARKRFLGRAAMQELVDQVGGSQQFGQLLDRANAESPLKHEKVVIKLDAFLDETNRSWKVLINGEVRFIPKALGDPIDNESMKMVKGYAINQGFQILSEIEGGDSDDIPLNFQTDLLTVLQREFKLYLSGSPYNSALVITPFCGAPTIARNTPCVRLNLRKEVFVPSDVPILLLDALGNPDLLSLLIRRDIDVCELPSVCPDTEITQVLDGSYGITSLWNQKTDQPKSSLDRLMKKAVIPLCGKTPAETLVITWKKVADYLRGLQDKGELPRSVAVEHYGNLEGSNEYQDRRTVILLGTPQINPADLEELAHALFANDDEPISMDTLEVFKAYDYVDCDGNGYETLVKCFVDDRVQLLARTFREDEIMQAAHRIRPLLTGGKQIVLLTDLPINDLPPTRLTTLDDLAASLDIDIEVENGHDQISQGFFNDIVEQLMAENESFCFEWMKAALSQTLVKCSIRDINSENDQRQSPPTLVADSTLKRWLNQFAREKGWHRSKVSVVRRNPKRGGGATWVVVYHEDPELDSALVRTDYAELMDLQPGDNIIIELVEWEDEVVDFENYRQGDLFFMPRLE